MRASSLQFGSNPGRNLGVPEPILLSWQSRLNALPAFDLEVIKCASCIGTHFRASEIAMCMAAMLDDKVDVERVICVAFQEDADDTAAGDGDGDGDGDRDRGRDVLAAAAECVAITATQLLPRVRAALSRLAQDGLVVWDGDVFAPPAAAPVITPVIEDEAVEHEEAGTSMHSFHYL